MSACVGGRELKCVYAFFNGGMSTQTLYITIMYAIFQASSFSSLFNVHPFIHDDANIIVCL